MTEQLVLPRHPSNRAGKVGIFNPPKQFNHFITTYVGPCYHTVRIKRDSYASLKRLLIANGRTMLSTDESEPERFLMRHTT